MKQGAGFKRLTKTEARYLVFQDLPLVDEEKYEMGECLKRSSELWVGIYRGTIGCVWGLIPPTILSDKAYLWLYTNQDMVLEHQFTFIRASQIIVKGLLEKYSVIYGTVERKYPRARLWIEWLGGEITPEGNTLRFEIRRK